MVRARRRNHEEGIENAVEAAVVRRDWVGMWRAERTAHLRKRLVRVDGMGTGVAVVAVAVVAAAEVVDDDCSSLDRVAIVAAPVVRVVSSQYCVTCAWCRRMRRQVVGWGYCFGLPGRGSRRFASHSSTSRGMTTWE